MDSIFQEMSGAQFLAFVAIVMGLGGFFGVLACAVVLPAWKRVRQLEAETALKRELVAGGYTATEILDIVQASATATRWRQSADV